MELTVKLEKQGKRLLDLSSATTSDAKHLGVFGPSGAGKSTLLRILAGLESGEQILNWKGWANNETPRVGLVFQHSGLFPHLNVKENLEFAQSLAQTPRVTLAEVIETFSLNPLLEANVDKLSGGERQRVALARAFVNSPDIILLDEPFSSVDTAGRQALLDAVLTLCRAHDMPAVLVSHDLSEIALFSQRVWWLKDGELAGQGNCADMVSQISHSQPVPFAVLSGQTHPHPKHPELVALNCDGVEVLARATVSAGDTGKVVIPATQVSIALENMPSSIVNRVPCQVKGIGSFDDSRNLITLQIGQQVLFSTISIWSTEQLALRVGQSVYAQFKLL